VIGPLTKALLLNTLLFGTPIAYAARRFLGGRLLRRN
jgi:hypothetical protein